MTESTEKPETVESLKVWLEAARREVESQRTRANLFRDRAENAESVIREMDSEISQLLPRQEGGYVRHTTGQLMAQHHALYPASPIGHKSSCKDLDEDD